MCDVGCAPSKEVPIERSFKDLPSEGLDDKVLHGLGTLRGGERVFVMLADDVFKGGSYVSCDFRVLWRSHFRHSMLGRRT